MVVRQLRTDRLLLRGWKRTDRSRFAKINAHHEVMRHFPGTLSRQQSDQLADRISSQLVQNNWGLWAVELIRQRQFVGFVGLQPTPPALPCSPAVEIGWRLNYAHWGQGYATEAALRALEFAFGALELGEVVSFTAASNLRSQAVMERLGMQPAGSFDHPALPPGHRLRKHQLFRLERARWRRAQPGAILS